MKLRVLTLLAFVLAGFTMSNAQQDANPNVVRCYSMEADAHLRQQHPELGSLDDFEAWLAPKVAQYKAEGNRIGAVTTIPVIFHIIHNNEAVGSGRNIAASYVQAQVDQLNNDFRRVLGTSGYNTNAVGADTEIEFCLATLDENGNTLSEPGINRVFISGSPFSTNQIDASVKPSTQWDPERYCNVWSCDISGGTLGYAQFPSSSGLGGLNSNGGAANTDGVVVRYTSIGSTDLPVAGAAPYNEGRTLTHEIGHWLGLRHIWGDGGCGVDDYCADTPESDGSNFGCPTTHVSCGSTDMVRNYMDYTDDDCMNIFTQDQKARIQTVMANSPRRVNLATSDRCGSGGGGGGDDLTCTTTITSYPYSESFESGLGGWTQGSGDDFDWTRDSGGTPSSGTGPTTGAAGSWYMYVEASSPNYPSKVTNFDGPCFDLSGQTQASFTFSYHAQGSAAGTTELQANTGSGWSTIWSISGDQGANWNAQSVDLAAYLGTTVQLRFVGSTAASWAGDMAVDDIGLSTSGGGGGGGNCTASVSSYPYAESFEAGFGNWSQGSGDDLDWTRDSGGTPSSGTGPGTGADGTWYMYVEASGNGTGYPNKVTYLNGPCFDLTNESQADFSFAYHMYSSGSAGDVGSLDLEASTDDGSSWTNIGSISGSQGDVWNNSSVSLNAYTGSTVRVRFVGTTAATWRGDIAVDDIGLSTSGGGGGGCTTVNISITFDNYPEETSWAITDAGGATVASGGTYASQADGSTLNLTECLSAGCYDFTISDSYGDGICCSYGNGSYTVSTSAGTVASGSSFTSNETTNFCVSGGNREESPAGLAAQSNFEGFNLFPNPTRSILNVGFEAANSGQTTLTVTDLAGKIMLRQDADVAQGHNQIVLKVRDLAQGTYLLFMNDENGQVSKRFVIMK